jgi:hypothetical protein
MHPESLMINGPGNTVDFVSGSLLAWWLCGLSGLSVLGGNQRSQNRGLDDDFY